MCERIRKGSLVTINPSFIKEFNRGDLNPDDTYKVINVVSVCGDKKVANMVNEKTRLKIDLFTCNLSIV